MFPLLSNSSLLYIDYSFSLHIASIVGLWVY